MCTKPFCTLVGFNEIGATLLVSDETRTRTSCDDPKCVSFPKNLGITMTAVTTPVTASCANGSDAATKTPALANATVCRRERTRGWSMFAQTNGVPHSQKSMLATLDGCADVGIVSMTNTVGGAAAVIHLAWLRWVE
jgi:hypothetical protein